MAAPVTRRGRQRPFLVLAAMTAATTLLPAAAVDPSGWTPDECQCTADPAVVALCSAATFYPPDIAPSDWETIGDQYVNIVADSSLTEDQRQARYGPLMTQSGLDQANFTIFGVKYNALQQIPAPEELRTISGYCSVSYNSSTGYMPCQCQGGGMVELTLLIEDPPNVQFSTDEEGTKQKVLAVLEEKLPESLGLWYTFVSIDGVAAGDTGGTEATVHVTFSTIVRSDIEERFSDIEDLLGQAGVLALSDSSQSITLGASTLNLQVLVCAGPAAPPSELPADVIPSTTDDILAGASVEFSCPVGKKFSNGASTERRRCTSQGRLGSQTSQPLTCINEAATVAPQTSTAMSSSSAMPSSEGSTQSTTTYVPENQAIDVDWNDGKSIKKVDPNKPNLLMRITIPSATVIFVMLVLYLLCTRPSSWMCNTCGGGKLEEIA